MAELLDRLEAATGADREIDARLDHIVYRRGLYYGRGDDLGYVPPVNVDEWDDERWREAARTLSSTTPAHTLSTDAATALVRQVAPHARLMFESDHNGWGWAMVQLSVNSKRVMGEGAHPALALCIALVTAMQAGAAVPKQAQPREDV